MVKKTVDLLPKGHPNRPGYSMKAKGLIFHTTNNWADGAGDELHAEYMENQKDRVVSWHATVDKDSWTQHLPFNENGWHAGDGGKGLYNRNWIGLEIACEAVAPGQALDKATYNNAVEVAAVIMKENGLTDWGQLQPHNIVYGKDCPHHTLFNRDQFKKDAFAKLAAMNSTKPAEPKPKDPEGGDYLHIVKSGDTLTEIAEMYKTSVDYLARLNGLENPNKLYVGQRIKLKGTAPAPAPTPKPPVVKAPVNHNVPNSTLEPGSKGQAVIDFQEVLYDHEPRFNPGKIDGSYGPKTQDAVKRYQMYYGLKPYDGIYGPKTAAHLKATYK